MLETLREYQYTIAAIVIVVAAFAIYQFFFAGSGSDELVSSENQVARQEIAQQGARIQSLLGELEQIDLEGKVFQREAFRELVDYSEPLEEEAMGRTDPFAPSPGVVNPQQ
jgi:hypothetical protein